MIAYLERALNLRRSEMLPATALFSYLFLVIAYYITGQSVGDALFLNAYPPSNLPHAIMGTAVTAAIFVSIYIPLSHRVRLEPLIIGSLLFFAASFVGFWWLTRFNFKFVYALIYLWVYTSGVVGTMTRW